MLTKKSEVLLFVKRYLLEHRGRGPSYDEIMEATGILSKSNVKPILDELVEDGALEHHGVRGVQLPGSKLVVAEDELVEEDALE